MLGAAFMSSPALSKLAVNVTGLACLSAALPTLFWMPLWVTAVVLLALGYRLAQEQWPRLPRPPGPLRLLLTIAVVAVLLIEFRTLLGRQAGVTLLTLMLSLKFLETASRRDALLTVTLCYFVTACQGLLSQTMAIAGYMVFTVLLITLCLRVLNAPEQRSELRLGPSASQSFSVWRILRALLIPLLHALPLAVIFFLFVPRLGTPVFGVPEDAMEARTGLSDEMAPGSVSKLYIDDDPVFRVRFETAAPDQSQMYWRGPVLWNFDGTKWTASWGYSRVPAQIAGLTQAATTLRYEVILEPTDRNWLFALDVASSAPEGAQITRDFQLVSRKPIISLKRYTQTSDSGLMSRVRDDRSANLALGLPPDRNLKTLELGAQWRRETPDPSALVERALRKFRDEEYFYTLNPQTLGIDPVDDFLFKTREGYCEHFASAFTVLMRASGVPARVVTGYQGGYKSAAADYWIVRQSDAHAWSEVWLDERGWVRVDPTSAVSPDRINRGVDAAMRPNRYAEQPWLRDLRDRFDLINDVWNRTILTFNAARQNALLEPFGIPEMDWRYSAGALVGGLLLTALLVMVTLWWWQRRAPRDPMAQELAALRRALARRGVEAGAHLGPTELLALINLRFAGARHAADFLNQLNLARYAQALPSAAQVQQIRLLSTRAQRQIRKLPLQSGA